MIGGKVSIADWKTYLRWHLYRQRPTSSPSASSTRSFRWRQALVGREEAPAALEALRARGRRRHGRGARAAVREEDARRRGQGDRRRRWSRRSRRRCTRTSRSSPGWTSATRKAALGKLAKIANKIGYPDKWRNYDDARRSRATSLRAERDARVGVRARAPAGEDRQARRSRRVADDARRR